MLELHEISRAYGDREVLKNLSFTVPDGCLTGFIGANGAGKTTTMRIAIGVLSPDAGTVLWQSRPITSGDQRRFGYMPEERGLYPKQPVLDQLVFFGEIYRMTASEAKRKAHHFLELFGLIDRAKEPLESLSLGNQQRIQIIAALIHDPICLILDEPFSGLDPLAVEAMGEVLRERAKAGAPVLFSSHQLELVEKLCDEMVILSDGAVRAAGSSAELRREAATLYRLETEQDMGWLTSMPDIEITKVTGDSVEFTVTAPGAEQEVLARSISNGKVAGFSRIEPSLSEIFLAGER